MNEGLNVEREHQPVSEMRKTQIRIRWHHTQTSNQVNYLLFTRKLGKMRQTRQKVFGEFA